MSNWQLTEILDLVLESGRLGLAYYGKTSSELKSDGSVVTAADRGIETFLAQKFDRPEAGHYLLGEETLETRSEAYIASALASEHCWVVDPIDGTAPFTAEFPAWGVSVGLACRGSFVEGVIYLPAQGYLMVSDGDSVWHCECVRPEDTAQTLKLVPLHPKMMHMTGAGHVGITQRYAKHAELDFPHAVFTWCSCVTPFYYMATGRLLAYFVDAKIWDVAGGFPILKKLGFRFWDMAGHRMMDPQLNDEYFYLNQEAGKLRWYQRQVALISADEEVAHYFDLRVRQIEGRK